MMEPWNRYLGQAPGSLVNLVSGGFVLLVEVEDHQSCIHFPHGHLVGWKAQRAREGTQEEG